MQSTKSQRKGKIKKINLKLQKKAASAVAEARKQEL